jgi:hypothetical protein
MKGLLTNLIILFALATLSANIQAKNVISGKLLTSNGKPLPYIEIELVPIDAETIVINENLFTVSGPNGKFSFGNVPTGNFNLSINFNESPTKLSPFETCFYPKTIVRSEAKVFETDINTKVTGLVFQLPPQSEKRTITGKVFWSNKKPAANSFVLLRDAKTERDFSVISDYKTDTKGNFTLSGFDNRKYQIISFYTESQVIYEKPSALAKSEVFVLDKNTIPVELTLKNVNGSDNFLENDVGMLFFNEIYNLKHPNILRY